jgi:hypothetical protein
MTKAVLGRDLQHIRGIQRELAPLDREQGRSDRPADV